MDVDKTIALPSFLRRTLRAYALKAMIREQGCVLQRQGRSRNWLLTANTEQLHNIVNFIESENEASWLWLAKHLKQQYQQLNHASLMALAARQNINTVTKLIALTDCTLAQARRVIDELEGLD
ncbi:ribosome recycling factor family protein [Colwellia sp. D2M02]|uniref:Ribosome recycling factor n=1 Tax=Colwellia asteriadis TaxID=517723 RepID=A0ABN1L5S8_9GAMM|nr:ribosome recycling factor family protein [Colwellia sp. D2M02]